MTMVPGVVIGNQQTWFDVPTMTGSSMTNPYVTYQWSSPSAVEVKMELKKPDPTKKEISASLYIKFVKSKFSKIRIDRIKRRLGKLQKLVAYSTEMGQQALYEELTKEVAILVREAEAVAFGIDRIIDIKDIEKFRSIVKEKVIKFGKIETFPRVIPAKIQKKIKVLNETKVFDDLWILYIDYTKQPDLKTNKEKIRQKDPILFGQFSHQKEKYYYIDDWVDEYCDLTLDKFVDKIKTEDPEFQLSHIPDLSEERWKGIVQEVKDRAGRLDETRASNFRDLMAKEDALKKEREAKAKEAEAVKRPWWKVWGK